MNEIQEAFKQEILDNFEDNKKSALQVKEYLENSSVAYRGRCVNTLHIPKVYNKKTLEHFDYIVKITYSIFEKIIREYLQNEDYRKLFPFSKNIEELILIDNNYESLLPIARFDIFYNENNGAFKYCEINTDGTSAMNEDRELNIALSKNITYNSLNKKYNFSSYELFDSWVTEFINIYKTYKYKKEKPFIAIVDFLEGGCPPEFLHFKKSFEKFGYKTEICEIKDLKFKNNELYSPNGNKIDVVYRRAVTSDIEKNYNEIPAFIKAVKNSAVCLIGSFCTQIVHNKYLFKIIKEELTLRLLSDEEKKFVESHIPNTFLLNDGGFDQKAIISQKDSWIIKPLDSYGSKGVFAGIDCSQSRWEKLVLKNKNKNYIIQEYYTPFKTDNIYFQGENPVMKKYSNLTGLFVYGGKFKGIYARLSDGGIISSEYNEKAVATLKLEE